MYSARSGVRRAVKGLKLLESDHTEYRIAQMVDASVRTPPGDVLALLDLMCDLLGAREARFYVADYSYHTIRKGVPPWGPIPRLHIELSCNQAVLFWTSSASNSVLETQGALLPEQPWSSLTNGIALVSGRFALSRPLSSTSGIYRLRRL